MVSAPGRCACGTERTSTWSALSTCCIRERIPDRANNGCEIGLRCCVTVDAPADVERRRLAERSKARDHVCGRPFGVEMPPMAAPLMETMRCGFRIAHTVDVDQVMRRSIEPVDGRSRI